MRKIDITDKLNFEENPKLIIKGTEYEVNADATAMLKVIGILGDGGDVNPKSVNELYECIFSEKERKKLEKLHLNFDDLQTIISTAMELIQGEKSKGE